jgi:transposase InsO family protein
MSRTRQLRRFATHRAEHHQGQHRKRLKPRKVQKGWMEQRRPPKAHNGVLKRDCPERRYLFVAIDRATRWVFIRVYNNKTAANARRFLRDLERACPIHIRTILTDNGKEFTDRLFGLRKRPATGAHAFDQLCADLDIEHRLTPPKSPQTNGMVERFNGRIEEVLQSHHFKSGDELETTLHRYVWLYNQQLPQSALASRTPLQAMKDWYKFKPELFKNQPYYLPGCDS